MSDTPRVDAWIAEHGDDGLVYADFARDLERALAEARLALRHVAHELDQAYGGIDSLGLHHPARVAYRHATEAMHSAGPSDKEQGAR